MRKSMPLILTGLLFFSCSHLNKNHLVLETDEKILSTPENKTNVGNDMIRYQDSCSGKYGFKNITGDVLISARYELAEKFNSYGLGTVWLGSKPDNWFRIDMTGAVLMKAYFYDNGPDYYYRNRARYVGDGKLGYHDMAGTLITEPDFDQADPFHYNYPYTYVAKNKLWGVIDIQGKIIIPLEYEKLEDDKSPFVKLKKENKCHRINVENAIVSLMPIDC